MVVGKFLAIFVALIGLVWVKEVKGHEEGHSEGVNGTALALEKWDLDHDNALNEMEIDGMILGLTGGVQGFCLTAHQVMNMSNIPDGGLADTEAKLMMVLANIYPCVAKVATSAVFEYECGDEHDPDQHVEYVCTVQPEDEEEGEHHDEEEEGEHHDEEEEGEHHDEEEEGEHHDEEEEDEHHDDEEEGEHHDDEHGHGDHESKILHAGSKKLVCGPKPKESLGEGEEEEDSGSYSASVWGQALGATLLTSLCALIGLIPMVFSSKVFSTKILNDVVAFAVGVLVAAVFIHILPEVMITADIEAWKIGTCIVGGVMSALVIEMGSNMLHGGHHHHHNHNHHNHVPSFRKNHSTKDPETSTSEQESNDEELKTDTSVHVDLGDELQLEDVKVETKETATDAVVIETNPVESVPSEGAPEVQYGIVFNVVLGDGIHNFTDGMLIGVAFSLCSGSSVGWIVTAAIICHEIPQELVDFLILLRAGLTPMRALMFNLVSSLASLLGCIMVLAIGSQLSSKGNAYLVSYAGGFLTYVALAELVPIMVAADSSRRKLFRLVLVLIGILLISALTQFDVHCEVDGHGHGEDDGHGH